jgi:hypothetical protein
MKKFVIYVSVAFLFLSITVCFTGCGKKIPIPENKKSFVGTWISETQDTIVIRANGDGNAHVGNTTISGGAVRFPDANSISIKAIGLGPTMKINQPPQEAEGKWVMVLDGITFKKQ